MQGIKPETIEELSKQGGIRRMEKGTVCFRAREATSHLYILIEGRAIIYNLTNQGQRKIIYILGSGQLLNESVVTPHPPGTFCEILETSQVFVIRQTRFLKLMKQDAQLAENLLLSYERKIWRLSHQLKNTTGSTNLERKLAAKLWKLARDFGKKTPKGITIEINMSITFLADLLGAPRETVSRLCKSLVNRGLIQIDRKKITVVDSKGLAEFYKEGS
jgi:CRP-like cAMP-binding protein